MQAGADVIVQTGAQLAANPNAMFPTRIYSVNGSTLSFDAGSSGSSDVVMLWKIADAGTITTDTHFSITANVRRDTLDWDPWLGLYDGSVWVGASFSDNDDGNIRAFEGNLFNGNTKVANGLLHSESSAPSIFAVGNSGELKLSVLLRATTADVSVTFDNTTLSFSRPFNRSAQLSLMMGLENQEEQLTINSIQFSSTAVPEPSSIVAFAVACGLGWLTRRNS